MTGLIRMGLRSWTSYGNCFPSLNSILPLCLLLIWCSTSSFPIICTYMYPSSTVAEGWGNPCGRVSLSENQANKTFASNQKVSAPCDGCHCMSLIPQRACVRRVFWPVARGKRQPVMQNESQKTLFPTAPTFGALEARQVACQNENEMKCSESCWKSYSPLTNNFISCLSALLFSGKGVERRAVPPLISFLSFHFVWGINFIWFCSPFAGHETMCKSIRETPKESRIYSEETFEEKFVV